MTLIIDAHQHVWDLNRSSYRWLGKHLSPIDRTITFSELLPSLRRAGVSGTVLVQADDTVEDTALMLEVAAANPEIVAVVGYLPLDRPAEVRSRISSFVDSPLLVGVRNLIHDLPDPHWLLRPDVDESLGLIESAGLTFDLVSVLPAHLQLVPTLVARHPGLRIVIDHLSKPPIGLANREPWWSLIEAAAQLPTVYAKVSGLYSATAKTDAWSPDEVRPFLHHALDLFGSHRLMYGGDWPVSILAGGYDRVWDALDLLLGELAPTDADNILGATAIEFYGIDSARLQAAIVPPPI